MLNIAILRLKIVKMQDILKQKILKESIKIVATEGWHKGVLAKASESASLNSSVGTIAFPGGIAELVEFFTHHIDQEMMKEFNKLDVSGMRIHEKIRNCVVSRLIVFNSYQATCEKTIKFLSLPTNLKLSMKILWHTVDYIWHEAAQDQSTDFNYYTKRMLLMAVYSSTLMHWLSDKSEGKKDSIEFLDRRLKNVGMINKIKQKILNLI